MCIVNVLFFILPAPVPSVNMNEFFFVMASLSFSVLTVVRERYFTVYFVQHTQPSSSIESAIHFMSP